MSNPIYDPYKSGPLKPQRDFPFLWSLILFLSPIYNYLQVEKSMFPNLPWLSPTVNALAILIFVFAPLQWLIGHVYLIEPQKQNRSKLVFLVILTLISITSWPISKIIVLNHELEAKDKIIGQLKKNQKKEIRDFSQTIDNYVNQLGQVAILFNQTADNTNKEDPGPKYALLCGQIGGYLNGYLGYNFYIEFMKIRPDPDHAAYSVSMGYQDQIDTLFKRVKWLGDIKDKVEKGEITIHRQARTKPQETN